MKNYTFNKTTLIKIAVVVIVISSVLFLLLTGSSKEETDSTINIPEDNGAKKVFIKDIHTLDDPVVLEMENHIEDRLYFYASEGVPDLYTGKVRQGSYSSVSAKKVTKKRFLVDIMPINKTFQVTITTLNGNSTIRVGCAPEDQRMDKSVECEDSEYI